MANAMRKFIKNNRDEITKRIIKLHPDTESLVSMNDEERRVMIINEPKLTEWARSEGVVIA